MAGHPCVRIKSPGWTRVVILLMGAYGTIMAHWALDALSEGTIGRTIVTARVNRNDKH